MKNSADLGGYYPPRPSASVENALLVLKNLSYPTQPHSIIAKYRRPQAPQAQKTWCMRQLVYIENCMGKLPIENNCVNNYLIWNKVFLPQMCRVLVSCVDFKAILTRLVKLFETVAPQEKQRFLDWTSLVNKGFIIWLLGKFLLRDKAGSPEGARWLHFARSGSQSQRRIWFILPARGVVPNSYRSEGQPRSTRSEFPSRGVFGNCRNCWNLQYGGRV